MFNDRYGLTEAVLSGKKTKTRRLIKLNDVEDYTADIAYAGKTWGAIEKSIIVRHAKYKVGEVVAVAQRYSDFGAYCLDSRAMTNKMFVKAEYMPHQIRITNVRVERLQDISDEDCIKEGIGISATDNRIGRPFGIPFKYYVGEDKKGCRYSTPREAYAALIDRISGKGTWERNPFVLVYDFELVK